MIQDTASYYGMQIRNHTQAFEWYHFNDLEWPLAQIQGHDIIQRQTRKWYKAELYLQWQTSSKSHNCLANGANFNDLEQPLTPISRSWQ